MIMVTMTTMIFSNKLNFKIHYVQALKGISTKHWAGKIITRVPC